MSVTILTVPFDSGRLRERMGLGPEHLLQNALEPLLRRLGIPVVSKEIMLAGEYPTEIQSYFSLCRLVSQHVQAARHDGSFPIVLSGNCGIAVGAVAGCDAARTGVVWFDAHGEGNTPETTQSGFLDGMGIGILTGQCWRPLAASIPGFTPVPERRVVLVGSRDVDEEESKLLDRAGVVRVRNVRGLSDALADVRKETEGFYLHVDLDVLDPTEAVANQWSIKDGLTRQELFDGVGHISGLGHGSLLGFGIGSYNPASDTDGRALRVASAMLERILTMRR